jgi:hypothetical protein
MQRTLLAVIAIGATISALFLGEHVGGPLARAILGPPAGFHEDSLHVQPWDKPCSCKPCLLALHSCCWGQLQGGDSRVTVI